MNDFEKEDLKDEIVQLLNFESEGAWSAKQLWRSANLDMPKADFRLILDELEQEDRIIGIDRSEERFYMHAKFRYCTDCPFMFSKWRELTCKICPHMT